MSFAEIGKMTRAQIKLAVEKIANRYRMRNGVTEGSSSGSGGQRVPMMGADLKALLGK